MATLVPKLRGLSSDDLRNLGGALSEIVKEDLEREHSLMFEQIRVWWQWYDAEPRVKTRTRPWRGASNVVLPIIRTASDALTARMFNALQTNRRRMWIGRAENAEFADRFLDDIMRFINWGARHEFDTFFAPFDWVSEMVPIGSSVLQLTWEEAERHLLLPGQRRPRRVSLRRGPKLTHIPRENVLWTPGVPLQESEVVIVKHPMTWTDMVRRVQTEGWDEEAVQATKHFPEEHGDNAATIAAEKARRSGQDLVLSRALYGNRTAWVDWPLIRDMGIDTDKVAIPGEQDADRISVPLVVEFNPDSQKVFRVNPNPYLGMDGWPLFDITFRKRSGYPGGIGVAKILDHIQRGMTTMVNQSIDAVTLSNSMPFATTDPKWRDRRIEPGQGVWVDNTENIAPLEISKFITPDIQVAGFLNSLGERAVGLSDPQFGREGRVGGHPSPATNFLGLMQQSQELSAPAVKTLREQWSKIGEAIATLYQQFDTDPEGRIQRIFGGEDGNNIRQFLFPTEDSIPGNVEFDVFALSETENPQQEMNRAVLVSQMTQNYMASLLRILPALESPQTPPRTKQAIVKSVEALGKSHQHFLESADVDEAQEFIFKLQETGSRDGQLLQRLGEIVREAAGGQRSLPGGEGGASGAGILQEAGVSGVPGGGAGRAGGRVLGVGQ